jgi:uncharacterized protein YuzE
MATVTAGKFIGRCTQLASDVLRMPMRHLWIDYDEEADIMYISFKKPQHATKTVEMDDDILVRKDGKEIVGITIFNASTR